MTVQGELTPQIRTLNALAEDWGFVPSTHVEVHNHLKLQVHGTQHLASTRTMHTCSTHARKTLINTK